MKMTEQVEDQEEKKEVVQPKPKTRAKKVEAPPVNILDDPDFQDYQKFAELKFLMWDGKGFEKKKLNEASLAEFERLQKKILSGKGKKKPTVNRTIALGIQFGLPPLRLVEGVAVPDSLFNAIKAAGFDKKYFD